MSLERTQFERVRMSQLVTLKHFQSRQTVPWHWPLRHPLPLRHSLADRRLPMASPSPFNGFTGFNRFDGSNAVVPD